jgi:NAD(P)-dependent dehydrogenase (short-subunit alcohol dehydrogenase family)
MKRTYVVTGAASDIGASTAERGARVFRCYPHDADIDLAVRT